jgi:hypothetical protein
MSFYIKPLEGTLKYVGGHLTAFDFQKIYINGVEYKTLFGNGIELPTPIPANGEEIKVVVIFRYKI